MTAPNPTESPTQESSTQLDSKPAQTGSADASFSATETVELESNYVLPVAIVAITVPLGFFLNLWVGLVVGAFGIFLAVQASRIRLIFTPIALDVYKGETPFRSFPYAEWENWEIFWSPVPILFYFKEVNSIHFIPILYNPTALRQCLEVHQLPTQGSED
ncbi:MAG: DUF3119 family protein [Cyanobacteria bacterium P01_C01_bin.89]